ncbi:MAG: RDD family protein, partial [Acidobacteriia bacterium]|nr:RDD family protein [Terriglobia bacterium]
VVTEMQGRRISFLRATGRFFVKLLSAMLMMIGYLIQPFTEKRQALHDMMAGCLVLRKVTR